MNRRLWFLFAVAIFTICLIFVNADEDPLKVQDGSADNLKATEKETYEFQTEVSRLMKIIINSLYKTREIFLRELISNASDAIDKIRFLSLTDPNALSANPNLNITVKADPTNRILIIRDSGIGMTKKHLKENLGTIAKSGTSEFLDAMEKGKADMSLIGQFGVGFYSVFLVADRVVVASKHNDDKQYIWESTAVNDFSIAEDPRGNTLGRGTEIQLYLKEDGLEYLDEKRLQNLIKKYSEFINFPIYLSVHRTEVVEVDDEEDDKPADTEDKPADTEDKPADTEDKPADTEDKPADTEDRPADTEDESAKKTEESEDDGDLEVEDVTEKTESKPKKKTKEILVEEWEQMNTQKPIWTRDPKNVTDKEYEEFYYSLVKNEGSPPLSWIHFKAEGEVDFRSIVYIPKKAPADMFKKVQDYSRNIKLFVKRVFITDEFLDFVPKYLQFIRAIIDADDIPLNVSRETLQQHKTLQLIKRRLIKKILELIANLSRDEEKYAILMKEFGTNLKLGAIEDNRNRKKVAKLLRFPTSAENVNVTSLDDYIGRSKKGQESIYFVTCTTIEECEQSPFLERLLARGYEVLYMNEPIDEILVQHMPAYEGKVFRNIAKGDLTFGDETEDTKKEKELLKEKFSVLVDELKSTLSEYVDQVDVSNRLTVSPCAVIAHEYGWTGNMHRIMSAQAYRQEDEFMAKFYANQKKILEINPNHPLILGLLEKAKSGFDDETKELVHVLYETNLIRSGYQLKDNIKYASRVEKVLRQNLDIDVEAKATVNEEPAPELDEEEKKKLEELSKDEEFELDDDDEPSKHIKDEL
ncbi:6251_t:CDS:2 [Paraglomus occultum]|uniref:6251_t:CDS:1 n=1 Tax=Paraglomus occultum TaxID=144539 RepID=A0A9N8W7V5_9GLOM|nr:6251_t:CDS:2 [Paraglomus occultum]